MKGVEMNEIMEVTEVVDEVAENVVTKSNTGFAKKAGVVGAALLVAAGVYGIVRHVKAKKAGKNEDTVNAVGEDFE